jgi:ribosome biogenesis protein MAK21
LHARQLLTAQPITAAADLSLNTISHFLDRFVYKNPKKPKPKGASAMQPAATGTDGASGVKLLKGEVAHGEGPVNEEKWWRRVEDVPVDEVFFHRYFTQKSRKEREMAEKVKKRKGKGAADDEEGEDEDEDVDASGGEEDEESEGSEAEGAEEQEGEDDDEEESDKDEAEIWKVCRAPLVCKVLLTSMDRP